MVLEIGLAISLLLLGMQCGYWIRGAKNFDSDIKELLKLPNGWLIYQISQDPVTGSWTISAFSMDLKYEDGTSKLAAYIDAYSLEEAFQGLKENIKNEDYMEPDMVCIPEVVRDCEDVIDLYLKNKADQWDKDCDFMEKNGRSNGTDIPPSPGLVSYQMLMDELRSRIKRD